MKPYRVIQWATGTVGKVWVDVVRSPENAWLAPAEHLSRRQFVALGMMRSLVA